jgi:flagellar protein FlbD
MIEVTRLDGHQITVNADLIELIDANPDTHIRLTNGNSYLVLESRTEIVERVISYKQRLFRCLWNTQLDRES